LIKPAAFIRIRLETDQPANNAADADVVAAVMAAVVMPTRRRRSFISRSGCKGTAAGSDRFELRLLLVAQLTVKIV